MTIKEYQRKAMRTATPKCYNTANAALGLTGEAGEVADEVKKCMYQGHPWQPSKIIEELGDVLWYVTLMAELMNVPRHPRQRLLTSYTLSSHALHADGITCIKGGS